MVPLLTFHCISPNSYCRNLVSYKTWTFLWSLTKVVLLTLQSFSVSNSNNPRLLVSYVIHSGRRVPLGKIRDDLRPLDKNIIHMLFDVFVFHLSKVYTNPRHGYSSDMTWRFLEWKGPFNWHRWEQIIITSMRKLLTLKFVYLERKSGTSWISYKFQPFLS